MELNQCLESLQVLQDDSKLKLETVVLSILFVVVALFFIWISKHNYWDIPTLIVAGVFAVTAILTTVEIIRYPIQLKFYVMSDGETLVQTMQYFTLGSEISQVDDTFVYQISPKEETYKAVLKFERTLRTDWIDLFEISDNMVTCT